MNGAGTTLRRAHARLAALLGPDAEPIEVLERVEEHRTFWRPERVRVVLLAESHVYTTARELGRALRPSPELPAGVPRGFVRIVYALGYGEDSLLDRPIEGPRNSGTPQYWKIFQSCVSTPGSEVDRGSVQVSVTPDARQRLSAKLRVLNRLLERGVWLVDASVVALYQPGRRKPSAAVRERVLQTSWDEHTGSVVRDAAPAAVLCVGVGVSRALRSRLDTLGVPWAGVAQPQAHLSSAEHARIHELYSLVCDDPRRIREVPPVV